MNIAPLKVLGLKEPTVSPYRKKRDKVAHPAACYPTW
jgi:hypothetical protein